MYNKIIFAVVLTFLSQATYGATPLEGYLLSKFMKPELVTTLTAELSQNQIAESSVLSLLKEIEVTEGKVTVEAIIDRMGSTVTERGALTSIEIGTSKIKTFVPWVKLELSRRPVAQLKPLTTGQRFYGRHESVWDWVDMNFPTNGTGVKDGPSNEALLDRFALRSPVSNLGFRLVRTSLSSKSLGLSIVLDVSGSMPKEVLNSILNTVTILENGSEFTLTIFSHLAEVVIPPTKITSVSRTQILNQVKGLAQKFGGGTDIERGLTLGYNAMTRLSPNLRRELILITDGNSNLNIKDLKGLAQAASTSVVEGDISVIGVGSYVDHAQLKSIAAMSPNGTYRVADTFVDMDAAIISKLSVAKTRYLQKVVDILISQNTPNSRPPTPEELDLVLLETTDFEMITSEKIKSMSYADKLRVYNSSKIYSYVRDNRAAYRDAWRLLRGISPDTKEFILNQLAKDGISPDVLRLFLAELEAYEGRVVWEHTIYDLLTETNINKKIEMDNQLVDFLKKNLRISLEKAKSQNIERIFDFSKFDFSGAPWIEESKNIIFKEMQRESGLLASNGARKYAEKALSLEKLYGEYTSQSQLSFGSPGGSKRGFLTSLGYDFTAADLSVLKRSDYRWFSSEISRLSDAEWEPLLKTLKSYDSAINEGSLKQGITKVLQRMAELPGLKQIEPAASSLKNSAVSIGKKALGPIAIALIVYDVYQARQDAKREGITTVDAIVDRMIGNATFGLVPTYTSTQRTIAKALYNLGQDESLRGSWLWNQVHQQPEESFADKRRRQMQEAMGKQGIYLYPPKSNSGK